VNNSKRFVFLKEYTTELEKAQWPSGSLGRNVTPMRTLATDKKIFPRAAVTFIDVPNPMGAPQRIMLDQDTGGAIRAAGRADIYVGIGDSAGALAGQQYSEGHLYYVVMKPDEAAKVIARLGKQPGAVTGGTPARTTPAPRTTTTPRTGSTDEMFPK
jgi:membrane-bound lytic murein transglycosylase A